MRYPKIINKFYKKLGKKNSRFLNNTQFSLQIWANWGCLRGAQFLFDNFLNYKKKSRSETDMTYTHKGTVFKISETISNMRIFAIEVIRSAKSSNFLRFFKLFIKS